MSATKDTIALVRVRLTQAGVPYSQDGQTITAQCPVCHVEGDDAQPMTAEVRGADVAFTCVNGCASGAIVEAITYRHDPRRAAYDAYRVTWTDDKVPKLILPGNPKHDDPIAIAAWCTSVFQLDQEHPVIGFKRLGRRGTEGHALVYRAGGAPPISFEPIGAMYSSLRFLPMLRTQLLSTDQQPYGFRNDHCATIAHVVQLGCGVSIGPDMAEEAATVVGHFTFTAKAVEGVTTYGTPVQRHEAIEALRPELDAYGKQASPNRYLVDENTGEMVIRVSDLQETARNYYAKGLHHGWLDARMDALGWTRVTSQGYQFPGREGRKGPHSRCVVYRGHLPEISENDSQVNT